MGMINVYSLCKRASLVAQMVESTCNAGNLDLIPGLGRFPWTRNRLPTPVSWPGEFHGQRRLADYSPWGHRVRHDWVTVAVTAKSLQSCLTLCDHIDGSPPGSPIPGILQARILESVAISCFSA